tara:strand:+ start:85 stop:243 length:159 start_codon:yes stop_codon:yes gene_type:complete
MKMFVMMFVMMFCMGCASSITQIDMNKTDKRDVHQKIFDEMDEMFDTFRSLK